MIYQQKDTLCTYRSHTIDIDIQKYLPFLQVSIRKLSMVQFHILSIPGWFCKASDKTHSDPPSCKPHFNARKNGIPIIDSMDATHKAIFESCPSESGIFGWSDLSIYIYILYFKFSKHCSNCFRMPKIYVVILIGSKILSQNVSHHLTSHEMRAMQFGWGSCISLGAFRVQAHMLDSVDLFRLGMYITQRNLMKTFQKKGKKRKQKGDRRHINQDAFPPKQPGSCSPCWKGSLSSGY